jgi:hypothetical protein
MIDWTYWLVISPALIYIAMGLGTMVWNIAHRK